MLYESVPLGNATKERISIEPSRRIVRVGIEDVLACRKIKLEKVAQFKARKKCHPADHIYHAFHHNFTTNYHHETRQNLKNPPQNRNLPPQFKLLKKTKTISTLLRASR
jgi:hypothetical protein